MSAQESTSRSAVVTNSVLLPLSIIAVLLALAFFGIAAAFQSRGLTDDTLAAVAAALIGGIFLIAGIAGIQATQRKGNPEETKTASTRISNGIFRVISLLLGSVAVLGGIDFLCMSIIVLNQEHLHYFVFSTAIMGFGLTAIGLFLVWYAVHPLFRFKAVIQRLTKRRRDLQPGSPDPTQGDCKPQESS